MFTRYGARALIIAPFIPGLTTLAPPLAGMSGMRLRRYLALDAMGGDPIHAEQLAARLHQPAAELQGQLLALELAGLLERLPGGIFQRLRV